MNELHEALVKSIEQENAKARKEAKMAESAPRIENIDEAKTALDERIAEMRDLEKMFRRRASEEEASASRYSSLRYELERIRERMDPVPETETLPLHVVAAE